MLNFLAVTDLSATENIWTNVYMFYIITCLRKELTQYANRKYLS
jgi:predicted N-acyltransferase